MMRPLTKERERQIRRWGKLYKVRFEGMGTILTRACFPYEAVEEAARRNDMAEDEIPKYTVEEVQEPWYQ